MQSDGQHAHKILGQPGDNCESVVWSPDGHRIAFVRAVYRKGWEEADIPLASMISSSARPVICSQTPNSGLRLPGRPMAAWFILSANPRPTRTIPIFGPSGRRARQPNLGQPVRLTSGPDAKNTCESFRRRQTADISPLVGIPFHLCLQGGTGRRPPESAPAA